MKTIFSLALSLLIIHNISAECGLSGLYIFPKNKTIRQNPIFVLEGFGFSEHTIEGLNKDYPVYLLANDIKVPLTVQSMHKGEFELTQAILVPSESLAAGIEYRLMIDNLPSYEHIDHYNGSGVWTVIAGMDTMKPQLSSRPKEIDKSLIYFGCGPEAYVIFNCPVTDSSEFLVKATVKNLNSGKETSYYIETDGSLIKVGHEMCAGAFKFEEGRFYEVEFNFVDASGNVLPWKGPRIRFSKPTHAKDPRQEE